MITSESAVSGRTRRRLSPSARKAVLTVHIGSALSWLGVDIVLGVLVLRTVTTSDSTVAAVAYQAVGLFAVWTLLPLGLLTLASGVVLGMGTRHGVFRYWWVVVKLGITVLLIVLVPVGLAPTVEDAAEYGRALMTGANVGDPPKNLYFPPIVSPIAIMIALVLAIYKPWGRVRGDRTER